VVPRFAGPGQGRGRVRGQADSSFAGVVDTGWLGGCINTGIERRAQIKKSGARSNSRKFLQKIFLTARDRTTGYSRFWCVERPDSAIDNGNALIFPGQIEIRPSAATGYPAISRVD
jgi:hypothetical protein